MKVLPEPTDAQAHVCAAASAQSVPLVQWRRYAPLAVIGVLVGGFAVLQCLLPLGTAIKIGADEDFELAKSLLSLKGYKFYTAVWNDQPPLFVFLLTGLVKEFGLAVLWPRLLTVGFSFLLLSSVYLLTLRIYGFLAAALAAVLLMVSPGFLELSSSCMQEIPALAPVIASLCFLVLGWCTRGKPDTASAVHESEPEETVKTDPFCSLFTPFAPFDSGIRPDKQRNVPSCLSAVLAGSLFAVGLQMKLIGVIYLPLAALVLSVAASKPVQHGIHKRHQNGTGSSLLFRLFRVFRACSSGASPASAIVRNISVFSFALLITFLAINYLTGSPLFVQFQQGWASHFASAKSLERSSPLEHSFDWSVLAKHWDTTLPALVGVVVLLRRLRPWIPPLASQTHLPVPSNAERRARRRKPPLPNSHPSATDNEHWTWDVGPMLPLAWLLLTLVVFGMHKPWWAYYYVHTAVPLSLCAGVGIAWAVDCVRRCRCLSYGPEGGGRSGPPRYRALAAVFVVFMLCAASWMAGRVYLQITGIRGAPRIYSSMLLKEIERFKPFTRFLFTDQPIYSFHSGIPVPPQLGVMSLKRFWTGDMTEGRLVAELDSAQPELILLANDTSESLYQDRINRNYRLVYQDHANRLYAHKSIANKAKYD